MSKPGRNDPCPCGSGKKYKQCCLEKYLSAAPFSRPSPDPVMQAALQLHRAGNLSQAEAIYRGVLKEYPDHLDALFLLGRLAFESGNHEAATGLVGRALALAPDNPFFHNALGSICQALNKPDEAIAHFQKALALKPDFGDALYNMGNAYYRQGKLDESAACYQRALALNAGNAQAHFNLGNVYKDQGKLADAVSSYQNALAANPAYLEAQNNLGSVLKEQEKFTEAVGCYQKAITLNPRFAEAHFNLGNIYREQGDLVKAGACYRQTLAIDPDHAEACCNLGAVLKEQDNASGAVEIYKRALALSLHQDDAYYNLGNVFKELNEFDAAIESYKKALLLKPDHAETFNNLGIVFFSQGKLNTAIYCYQKAIELKPDFAEAQNNLGTLFMDQGKHGEARTCFQRALELKPDFIDACINSGLALQAQDNLELAIGYFYKALALKSDSAKAYHCLGGVLKDQGKPTEAIEHFNKALLLEPGSADIYSNALFLHAYQALLDPGRYLSLARGWQQACVPASDRQAAVSRDFGNLPLAGRKLRVGYVSGDFCFHSASYFIEQIFTHHNRTRIELFAYSNRKAADAVTERLQSMANRWTLITDVTDAKTRDRIHADGIDVLVDLSGHTAGNRLGVFARRAAPVQAHYLGYFASTGLTEMDYWIGDAILTPPEGDGHFSEKVWRLPRVWVSYDGKAEDPLPGWRPSGDGTIWIGSFNNLSKMNSSTFALWAQVLLALPEGHLLLKTKQLADIGSRQHVLDSMAAHGIAPDRIELKDTTATPGRTEHLAYYDRLDIALDPVGGVSGGTTTCDALWMGVPVLTLEGDRMASRMTASMLDAIGHPEWVARSEAEYVAKVVALARDVEGRKALRPIQRGKMATSPLCDARGLAGSLENAYFEMFERWREKALG